MGFALQKIASLNALVGCLLACALCSTARGQESGSQPSSERKDERRFDIWEYRVEGNSLLSNKTIEGAVYPYLGPQRVVGDIDEAANNLERAYRDAGYPTIFVAVPEQDVVGGVVRLQVLEGRIDRVRVEGARHFTPSGIRESLPSLQHGEVLHVPTMQQELNALNAASPDRKVTPVLKPGREPGTVDVDLKVRDESPLHGLVELNNYNSANTSESRLSASLSYDNLWQRQHSLSLQWQIAPQDIGEVNVLAATYVMPWFDTRNKFAFYAINSHSDVASVADTNVIGNGKIFGARFIAPLPSGLRTSQSFTTGVDYKDYSEIIRLDPENRIDTPIDYAVWLLQYDATRFGEKSQTQWSASANFGIRGIGNSDQEFSDKRFRASANFSYLRAQVRRIDYLRGDWQLTSRLSGQVTDSPLINNEQLSAGGENSVRGYYESQALGDSGVVGGLEIKTPGLYRRQDVIETLRLLVFLEGARLRVRDALPDQDNSVSLASAGLGLEMQVWRAIDLAIDWAYLLEANGDLERGDNRIHMGLQWKF